MQNKKLVIALIALIIFCGSIVAQNRTFSPYSRYGFGDIQGTSIGRGQGMGGTGIAQRSRFSLNDLNPAGISAMDSMSFVFEGGISYLKQDISSSSESATFKNGTFDFFAFGFPLSKKFFTSIGFKPYSGVGYNILTLSHPADSIDAQRNKATGEGTVTKAFLAIAFKPFENFSVGVNVGYLFGTQKHFSYTDYPNESYALKYGSLRTVSVSDLTLDFGAQYTYALKEKQRLIIGATLRPQSSLSGDVTNVVESGSNFDYTGGIFSRGDTLKSSTVSLKSSGSKLPLQLGIGLTYEIQDKLSTSIDYTTGFWSKTPFYESETSLKNSHHIACGAEFIPNELKTDNLLMRLRYRLGTYYKKEYLVLNGYQLEDYGVTVGLGLPMIRSKNSVNISVDYGVRGTTNYGLLKENYFKINLNISMQELWFAKRKFN